jgi:hypothetical protein
MKNSSALADASDAIDLDLPDWKGMRESVWRPSPEVVFELCEEYSTRFPEARRQHELQGRNKCTVPFVLSDD